MEAYIGEIRMAGFNFAPRGWAFCSGQLLSIDQHQALFSLLGTYYGGDGRSTFGLPDLRGRVPIHSADGDAGPGLSRYQLGQRGGAEAVTLTANEMPSHNHVTSTKASSTTRGNVSPTPEGAYWGGGSYTTTSNVTMASDAVAAGNSGGGQSHTNIQPYIGINFIISLEGVFPPRS